MKRFFYRHIAALLLLAALCFENSTGNIIGNTISDDISTNGAGSGFNTVEATYDDFGTGLISGVPVSELFLNNGQNNIFLATAGDGLPPCQPEDQNVIVLSGIGILDNPDQNFWGIQGNGTIIDPANEAKFGAHHWSPTLGTLQENASNISLPSLPTHTQPVLQSGSAPDCSMELTKSHTKGTKPLSVPQDTVGCGQSFLNGFHSSQNGNYSASYDTLEAYVQRCPTDVSAPFAFGRMSGDVQYGGNGASPECWKNFQQWLITALAWNPGSSEYLCADVETIVGTFETGDTGWTALNTATNKELSVVRWLMSNPLCAQSGDSSNYYEGREGQITQWIETQDTSKVPLDTTIYTMQQLGLDSVLEINADDGVSYDIQTSTILLDARLEGNPTDADALLWLSIGREAWLNISVYNVLGQQVPNSGFAGVFEQGTREVPLNVGNAPPGVYYIRIQTANNETETLKLIKE